MCNGDNTNLINFPPIPLKLSPCPFTLPVGSQSVSFSHNGRELLPFTAAVSGAAELCSQATNPPQKVL